MKIKNIAFLLLLFPFQFIHAQKKVTLEQIRCFSSIGPVMTYFRSEEVKRTVIEQFREILKRQQGLVLTDTTSVPVEMLRSAEGIDKIKVIFSDLDTNHFHLYFDIYEIDPATYFDYIQKDTRDTAMRERSKSIFMLKVWLVNSTKRIVFNESLSISVIPALTQGMGNLYINTIHYNSLITTAIGFTEMLKKGADILFDPKNELELIEMKVPPAFIADNYILPALLDQPRNFVTTNKGVSAYTYLSKTEMIRMGAAVYEEIRNKGKNNPAKYPIELISAINNATNSPVSDFLFLMQDCRDVIRDRNYVVKLCIQIDPDSRPANADFMFTNFLNGRFHYLLLEKDTVSSFTISKRVNDETGKKLYPDKVSNGVDTAGFFPLDTRQSEWPIVYNYVVAGKIGGQLFRIQCSGVGNRIKEIYLNEKKVCVAEGRFTPEKFVVFNASLSSELLNQLFIIGFNRFFE